MLNIAIDLGSFSVKGLCYKADKRRVKYINSFETIIDPDEFDISDENALIDYQISIVKDFLDSIKEEYTLYLNSPNDLLTSRILTLPVNSRKKANLMLPFQLETDLPFSISHAHYASTIEVGKTESSAIVSIAKKDDFSQIFNRIKEANLHPKSLTSDVSYFSSFIKNYAESLPSSFCILDLGHNSTKAYFFIGNKLISNHTSHIAGKAINEVISESYNISTEEASIYKHQNAYLLLEDQFDKVNEDQRKFARVMDETFLPLISDFKRWSVGFKVKFAEDISEIYVTGGSSNIKNLDNYFSQKVGVKVGHLDLFLDTISKKIDKDSKFRNKFSVSNLIAQASISRPSPINLLSKSFSLVEMKALPLDKLGFISVRVAILCIIFALSLGIERYFITKDIEEANKQIAAVLKNPTLELNKSIARKAKRSPKVPLRKINSKVKSIKQEVSLVQASANMNAFKSLETIAELSSANKELELIKFQSLSKGNFTALFKVENQKQIDQLDNIFSNSDGIFTEANLTNKTYKVNGSDL